MKTREDLNEKEIAELEEESRKFHGKSISLYTKEELLKEADDNHLWFNAFACINPTPEFAQKVGNSILQMLNETQMRDSLGISHMIILTINKS